jgi:predicted PurR-regulated permease PerM
MVSKKISKKLIIYLYVALVLSLVIILVLLNKEFFKDTTKRFMEVFNITNVKCFFEAHLDKTNILYEEIIDEVTSNIAERITNIANTFNQSEPFLDRIFNLISNLMMALCDFLIIFANIGLNILMVLFICLNETFTSTHLEPKKTLGAKIYLFIFNIIKRIICQEVSDIYFVRNQMT